MLVMVVNERHDAWDCILDIKFAYNNSVRAATGQVPNRGHMGRLSPLPLTDSTAPASFGTRV